jgi:DNA-binding Lrp family transcriptional regulator
MTGKMFLGMKILEDEESSPTKLRDVEMRLISELMKGSRRSDRELAKSVGTSQPTITRTRTKLERKGYIREYTMIPDFAKLGFTVMSVTFATWDKKLTSEEYVTLMEAGRALDKKKRLSVIMVSRGIGANFDLMIISLHESYSASQEFAGEIKRMPYSERLSLQHFIVDLTQNPTYRTLTFSSFAEYLLGSARTGKKGTAP